MSGWGLGWVEQVGEGVGCGVGGDTLSSQCRAAAGRPVQGSMWQCREWTSMLVHL